ncbi:putative TAM domain methyltransferase [Colletotrichum sublineola]|uniref:Putative TAM domain methyltransferase n=1 Tax=Colletotrichum sublineola TaxID=1173701 RepID=A0A066X4G0_COLSU|nr:putative TAM domain methyltransferase [Colletotrichum sublineola]
MDNHSHQRLRKNGYGSVPGSPVGRKQRPSTAANSVSAASASTRLTASSSSEHPRNSSADSGSRPRTPPSTRPSMQSGQQDDDDCPEDHPSPTSDEVSRALWAGGSDSDVSSDEATPSVSIRTTHSSAPNHCRTFRRQTPLGPGRKSQNGARRWHRARVMGITKINPTCAVMGVDIEKIRAPYSAPNCQFKLMDVMVDWTIDQHFDYIHVRMLGDVVDKEKFIQSIYDHLNPGGWVEFTEWIVVLHSPDRSLEGSAFQKWNVLLRQGLENMGRSASYVNEYQPLLEKAGFERLKLTKHAAPTNACYPGKKCQRFGEMMTNNWVSILEPLTVPIFTIGLGWPENEVHALVKKVRKEIPDTHYHSFMTL